MRAAVLLKCEIYCHWGGGWVFFFGGGVFISIGGRLSFSCNKMSEFLLFIFECYAKSQFEMFPRFAMIMNESLVRSAMKL